MDIENLVDIFKLEFIRTRPEINDFSQGSVLYTIARAISATVNEVYTELENLKTSFSLINEEEKANENLLSSISPAFQKVQGTTATGFVLISNLDPNLVTLPVNTVLTDPISLTQFTLSNSIAINSLTEVQAEVIATDIGAEYNLPAGRNLININFPRLTFTVGEYRDIDGTTKGDIGGGSNKETESEYYERVKGLIFKARVTQKQALIDYLLETYNLQSVNIQTLTGGLVTIWVNSPTTLTEQELTTMNDSIQDYLSVGTYSQVKQFLYRSVSVTVQTYVETNAVIDAEIYRVVSEYINKVKTNSVLSVTGIRNIISEKLGIIVKVLEPTSDIYLETDRQFKINSIEVVNGS